MSRTFLSIPIGNVALAARAWSRNGRTFLTVILKATFDLRHDGVMSLAAPAPIATIDEHFQRNPVASLLRASDLAFMLPTPEIVLVGAAFPGAGTSAPSTTARLHVQRDRAVLIDKRLDVLGDRRAAPGAAPPAPAPFERMPLLYERALGGMTSRENPVGRGLEADADGLVSHPNVTSPKAPGAAAGFGPIPSAWTARRARRGSLAASAAYDATQDVEVPADFDDAYFQTAPADQRVAELTGGELITLVHLHPTLETLRTYLPTLRGVALLEAANGQRVPLRLRIDTVHLEPEALRAEIVYRGAMTITPGLLADLRIAGALEAPDQPFAFPPLATLQVARPAAPQPKPLAPGEHAFGGTVVLEPQPARPAESATPFEGRAPSKPPPPMPVAPAHAFSGTMVVEPEPPRRDASANRTMFIEEPEPPRSLPFAKGPRRRRTGQLPAVVATKAATPWADSAPVVAPTAAGIVSTMLADEPDSPAPETQAVPIPQAAPPAPPPPPPPPPRDPNASPWREDPASAPVAAAVAAPKVVIPPRADFKANLYKKAKR